MPKASPDLTFQTLFDLSFVSSTFEEFTQKIAEIAETKKNITIFPVSVDVLIKSKKDSKFDDVLKRASFLTPDGMPIVWASRLLGKKLKSKISGSDLFPALCKEAAHRKLKVYFLGAQPGIAQKARKVLQKQNPELNIVGTYSPPIGFENSEEENRKILDLLVQSQPDILFMGVGAPKQEKWMHKHLKHLNIPVSVAVGASFDFVAGSVTRAPRWMQNIGLEWFFRLCKEPRRLWKRYVVGNTIYFWLVLKEIIR